MGETHTSFYQHKRLSMESFTSSLFQLFGAPFASFLKPLSVPVKPSTWTNAGLLHGWLCLEAATADSNLGVDPPLF